MEVYSWYPILGESELIEALQRRPHSNPRATLLQVVVTYYMPQSIRNPFLESWLSKPSLHQ